MARILIAGGTGLVGSRIVKQLIGLNHEVAILTRFPELYESSKHITYYKWDIDKGYIDPNALYGNEALIHVAGENIASKQWTEERKKEIAQSRIASVRLLFDEIQSKNIKLHAAVFASAIGYYGSFTSDNIIHEEDMAGDDFLAKTGQAWENEVMKFNKITRCIIFRLGIVLSNKGGVLKTILPASKFFVPVYFGNGKQFMPWVHIEDVANAFIQASFEHKYKGIFNLTAPTFSTNKEFTQTIANALQKKFIIGIPSFLLSFFLGELAMILLYGTRISSAKITHLGFEFKHIHLQKAISNLLNP